MIVKSLVAIMVGGMFFASCDKEDNMSEFAMWSNAPTPTPIVKKGWKHDRNDRVEKDSDNYVVTITDTLSKEKHINPGIAVLYCDQQDYTVEEKYEYLSTDKANKTLSIGEVQLTPTDTGYVAVTPISFELGDGNIGHVEDSTSRVNGVPYDVVKKAEVLSLANVDPQTRATYEKTKHTTEVVVRLTYETVGIENVPETQVVLRTLVERHILAEDDVLRAAAIDSTGYVIDDTREVRSFTERYWMKSGKTQDIKRSFILDRWFEGIPPYELTVESFVYNFSQSYGLKPGTEYPIECDEENLQKFEKVDSYSALIEGETPIITRSLYKYQRCVWKDNFGVTVGWGGYFKLSVEEGATNVSGAESDREGYDKAIVANTVNSLYDGYAQSISEYVYLYKKSNDVVDEGFEISSEDQSFTNSSQTCTINYFEKYRDGNIVRTPLAHVFGRELVCTSNFVSIEQNNSAQTDGARITSPTYENKKSPDTKVEGAVWEWVEERGSITANVTLAGSKKQDSWTYKEANSVKVTYKGKTHSFRVGQYELSNTANVGAGVEKGDYTEYKYSDVLSYKFSTAAAKQSTAPGTIKVEIEEEHFFPPYMGTLLSATETVAPDETRKDYCYTLSLHFTEGTMTAVVRRGSLAPEWHFESFIQSTDSRYNGGYYVKSSQTWVNTIANDGKDWMEWLDGANSNKGNMSYSTGTAWGWDEGHQNNGHPSVFTGRHTLTVKNGELKAYDNYLGKYLTDSNVNKNGGWK